MGGSGSTQSTQQQQTTQLPPWVNTAAQQNYGFAQNVANRPLQQYQGQQVADVGPASQQAWNMAQTSGGTGSPYYDAAQAGYMGILGGGAPQITPGLLQNTNLSPYMNPYTSNVINNSMGIMNQNLAQQLAGNAGQASAAGAFGGSRQGVQNAVNQAQTNMQGGLLASQLNQANFGQAQSAAQQDLANQLTAAQSNQNAALNWGNLGVQAAGGLAGLGQQANQNLLSRFGMLDQAGQEQQTQGQNIINANMNKFNQAWNYPTQQMGILQSALGMTPYGQSVTGTGQTNTQTSTDPMMAALGIANVVGGLFKSDERIKKDIKKIGTDPKSGLGIHEFRYKGQPKFTPKFAGPMAQEVERKFPGSTANVGGILHIKGREATQRGIPLPTTNSSILAAPNQITTPFGTARRAPDGNHYVQHPRTGKYFRVKKVANS